MNRYHLFTGYADEIVEAMDIKVIRPGVLQFIQGRTLLLVAAGQWRKA